MSRFPYKVRMRVATDNVAPGFAVYFIQDKPGGGPLLVTDITFKEKEEGFFFPEPTFTIGDEEAQIVMDGLWRGGVRPTDMAMIDGERAALKGNLEDLRYVMKSFLAGDKDA